MLNYPTFSYLVDRFGEVTAWHYLVEIEKAAHIRPQRSISDPELRLANALRTQDSMSEPVMNLAA